jgi:hypothetical protein
MLEMGRVLGDTLSTSKDSRPSKTAAQGTRRQTTLNGSIRDGSETDQRRGTAGGMTSMRASHMTRP